jgi:hypothetical protein
MKEFGLQLNVDKTNNMAVSGETNSGLIRSMKADCISLEIVE